MTRSIGYPYATPEITQRVIAVAEGGTGGTSPKTAAAALSAISLETLNQPNGPGELSGSLIKDSQLPDSIVNYPALYFQSAVHVNQTVEIFITNHDLEVYYDINFSAGSHYFQDGYIYYTAPEAAQTVTLTVNNRTVEFEVKDPIPAKPTIDTPTYGETSVELGAVVTASQMALSFGTPSHSKTEWQVSKTSDFAALVPLTGSVELAHNSIVLTGLKFAQDYYIRVRYLDSVYGFSEWSNASLFTTRTSENFYRAETYLVSPSPIANSLYGASIATTASNFFLIIGEPGATVGGFTNAGRVHVYCRTVAGFRWLQHTIDNPNPATGAKFGACVAVSSSGDRLAISRPGATTNSKASAGSVLIYKRTEENSYAFEQGISDPNGSCASGKFGISMAMSEDGKTLAIGAVRTSSDTVDYGYLFVYKASTTQLNDSTVANQYDWLNTAELTPSTGKVSGNNFASVLAINGAGNLIYASAPNATVNSLANAGAIYRFEENAGVWAQKDVITPASGSTASELFGSAMAITPAEALTGMGGYVLITGAPGGNSNKGKAYLFNNTTEITNFVISTGIAGDAFGTSVAVVANGLRCYVGSPNTAAIRGQVHMFVHNNGLWSWGNSLIEGDSGEKFGSGLCLSKDNERLMIAAGSALSNGVVSGGVYSFV